MFKYIKIEKPFIQCNSKYSFIKIEVENDKTMYHAKIMMEVYKLEFMIKICLAYY